jgi:hypothetical protein
LLNSHQVVTVNFPTANNLVNRATKHVADAQSYLRAAVDHKTQEIDRINTLTNATQEVAESIASAQRIIDISNNASKTFESINELRKLQEELQSRTRLAAGVDALPTK